MIQEWTDKRHDRAPERGEQLGQRLGLAEAVLAREVRAHANFRRAAQARLCECVGQVHTGDCPYWQIVRMSEEIDDEG